MPQLSSEKEWIAGCLRGDRLTQKLVYERFAPRMLSVCLRYLRQEVEAEEAMINGFLKVFNKINQYKSEGSFEGWIRRIMVNESLNLLRKKRHMYVEVDIENISDHLDYSTLENELDAEAILELIDALPVGYRTVFNLYAIEGYSHKEIGKMLDISESTSKSQLSRARNLLQKQMNNRPKHLNNINHG